MKNTRALEILGALLILGNLAALIFCTILLSKFYELFGAGLPSWVSVGLAVGLAVVAFLTSICATALQERAGPWPAKTSTCALLLVWGGVFYAMALTAPPHHVYIVLGLSCFVPVTTLFPGRVLGVLVVLHREFSREEHERTEQLRREAEARTRAESVRQQRVRDQARPAVPQPETPPSALPDGNEVLPEAPTAASFLEPVSEQPDLAASEQTREATEPQVVSMETAAETQMQSRPVSGDMEINGPRQVSGVVQVDRSLTPQSGPHPAGEGALEEPAPAPFSEPGPGTSVAVDTSPSEATEPPAPPAGQAAAKVRPRSTRGKAGAVKASGASGTSPVGQPPVPQTYASAVTLKPKDFLALTGVSCKVFEERLNLLKALETAQKGRGRKPGQLMEERLMMRQLHGTGRVNYRQVAQLYGIAETSVSRTVTAINNMLAEKE